MFGVALMRMIIFAVLKSNEITGGIAGSIEWFWKTLLKSAPIIPIGSGVWIGAVEQALQQTKRGIQNKMDDQYRNSDLAKMIRWREADVAGDSKNVIEDIKQWRKTLATAEAAPNQTFDDYNAAVPHFVQQAQDQKVSFASEPTNWKEAFSNKDFVAWAQSQKDGDGTVYDKLYANRMKQDLPGPKTERANTMETGYESFVGDKNTNKKEVYSTWEGRETLYRANGKVTSFERKLDKNSKVASFNVTTKTINENDITSKEDLETFQRLLNEKYKSVEALQKGVGTKYQTVVQALLADQSKAQVEVTIGNKKYMLDTDIKEDQTTKVKSIVGIKRIQEVGWQPPATPQNPSSPTTPSTPWTPSSSGGGQP